MSVALRLLVSLGKSYIPGHHRTLPNGRTVYIAAYFTKVVKKNPTEARKPPTLKHDQPVVGHTPLTQEMLAARLLRHVTEGGLSAEQAGQQLTHLEHAANAGHGLHHGHGHQWSAAEVQGFVAEGRRRLKGHVEPEPESIHDDQDAAQAEHLLTDLEDETAQVEAETQAIEAETDETPESQDVMLVTGKTYPHRHDLRRLGATWHDPEKGYIVPEHHEAAVEAFAEAQGLTVERADVPHDAFEKLTGDALRAYRQARLDKKISGWRAQAHRLEAQARQIDARLKPYDDWAFWTEPIKIGHHSEHRHRNLRNRLSALMDKKMRMGIEADGLRDKADRLERQGATVQGDAENRRQARREAVDTHVVVGSRVRSVIYGLGTVRKINKKTFTVLFDSGSTFTEDKSHVTPTGETVTAEDLKAQTVPKFKKGQRVMFAYIGRDREGIITAVGPSRYTIKGPLGSLKIDHAKVRAHPDVPSLGKSRRCLLALGKSHVPGHYRTLKDGRRIYVDPYFTKVVPKHVDTPTKPRGKGENPVPHGRLKVTTDALAHRLVQHVKDGRLSAQQAHEQIAHYVARAIAGHGMEHGGGHRFTPDQVREFATHAREGLAAHADAQQAQAEAEVEAKRLDVEKKAKAKEKRAAKKEAKIKLVVQVKAEETPVEPFPQDWAEKPNAEETQFHKTAFKDAPGWLKQVIADAPPLADVFTGKRVGRQYTCYNPQAKAVVMHAKHTTDMRNPGENTSGVWRHEYGHALDHAIAQANTDPEKRKLGYASAANVQALREDARPLMVAEKAGQAFLEQRADAITTLTDMIAFDPAKTEQLIRSYGFDPGELRAVLKQGSSLPEPMALAHFLTSMQLRDTRTVVSLIPRGRHSWDFQDCIGAITKKQIKLDAGHSTRYFNRGVKLGNGWTNLHTTEAFANWIEAEGNTGTFWRQLYAHFVPATTAAFRKGVNEWQTNRQAQTSNVS